MAPVYECNGKPLGLVFYNPDNREGAKEEADRLNEGLCAAGLTVRLAEWHSRDDLKKLMEDSNDLLSECTLLFSCIMSHGAAGMLATSDGSKDHQSINSFLLELAKRIVENVQYVLKIKEQTQY